MRSLVLTISLLFAFASTQGQGAMFLRGSQPAPQPGAGILDSYPGAAFAAAPDVLIYSSHSVTDNTVGSQTQGQTGPYTVLVRRDNDDALRSFTYTEVSDGTLTTWVGPANNGFVQVLYDQGTNGNHATQSTSTNQPKIVNNGSLVVENGKAALDFDGVNDWLFGPSTFPTGDIIISNFSVLKQTRFATGGNGLTGINPMEIEGDRRFVTLCVESTTAFAVRLQGGNTVFETTNGGNQSLFSALKTGLNIDFIAFKNSTSLLKTSSGVGKDLNIQSDSAFTFGVALFSSYENPAGFSQGFVQFTAWFFTDQSANRAAIETAINTEYNIY